MLYNLSLFLGTRERTYGIFALVSLFSAGGCSVFDGLGFTLWPESLYWQNRAVCLITLGMMIVACQFARHYLETAGRKTWLDRLNQILILLWLTMLPVFFLAPVSISVKITAPLAVVTLLGQMVVATTCLLQGSRMAVYYIVAWSGVLVVGIAMALSTRGLFPGYFFLSNYGMKLSLALLLLLLSLGQAHRMRLLAEFRERDQRRLVLPSWPA
jgi:two-component system, sensor histidine kinase LadS